MITVGENVVACGRLVEREDYGASLGFWGGGDEPWPDVLAPRGYPAVQLVLASPEPDLSPLRGSNVEVRGRWEAEGRIQVDRVAPVRASRSGGSVPPRAAVGARHARKRSARMAAAENPLFHSGDVLWRFLGNVPHRGGVVIRQRGSDRGCVDELVQVYAQERPGVRVTVHESRHTWQELEDTQAALLDLPDHQKASVGMGLNEDRSDVRLVVDLLYPSAEVLAKLAHLSEGLVQVNYLVRPLREVPESAWH